MREVHEALRQYQGRANPLDAVAEQIAQSSGLLCFDEFFVKDIGDAMILANLLKGLFERGVCLVTTSNVIPERLYEDGLQRDRFLPAIALLQSHTSVIEMAPGQDFRLRALANSELFITPAGSSADAALKQTMLQLSPEAPHFASAIEVSGRSLSVRAWADGVVWFDFAVLCEGPRSVADYIELAEECTAVLISDVPRFDGRNDDAARRFIHLVDEFYDRRVKLVIAAQVPILDLYGEGRLAFEFERTISRLREMQGEQYLASEHAHV
jgi:cell division protein ZapE